MSPARPPTWCCSTTTSPRSSPGSSKAAPRSLNVRRFLTYHLTDNVAELTPFVVWALSGGRFPLALGVLQILALDLGTDTLSAVALGAEPPARHLLDDPPVSGRLLNRTVARRAFGILGPAEAACSMAAFVLSLVVAGWRPGDPFPAGHALLAASGAAFMTVVIAQTANAFACRSASRWPGALGWFTNRLLLAGVAFGSGVLAARAVRRSDRRRARPGQPAAHRVGWSPLHRPGCCWPSMRSTSDGGGPERSR